MARKWQETVSPKCLHDVFGLYHRQWFSQMDRCWYWKVEHVTITRSNKGGVE